MGFTARAFDDLYEETDEMVTFTLPADTVNPATANNAAAVTITSDDDAPIVNLTADPDTVTEGGVVMVGAQIGNDSRFESAQTFTVAASGDAPVTPATAQTITIAADAGAQDAEVMFTVTENTVQNEADAKTLTFSATGAGDIIVTVKDDNPPDFGHQRAGDYQ